MQSLGYRIPMGEIGKWAGSTDVGNVSRLAPTIQPMVGIAPDDVLIHSVPFARAAATEKALAIMLDAARAMAMTAADILAGPEVFKAIREEFRKTV
jgi:metal-dependent amidase/aminoacylase/carboxypeptidase family protein